MTVFGWILVSGLSLFAVFFGVQLTRDILWNKKLATYQKHQGIRIAKKATLYWFKRSYGLVLTSLFAITTVFSGVFSVPNYLNDRLLLNAMPVGSEQQLRSLLQNNQQSSFWDMLFTERMITNDMAPGAPEADFQAAERDYIGTNVQVQGVDEADILKTDGNTFYYAARYFNTIRVMDVALNGDVTVLEDLDLGTLYVDGLYLTSTQLIVIGYKYEVMPYRGNAEIDLMGWGFVSYRGSVRIYDRETLEMVYELETDSNFYNHRLIDNSLFLISNKSLYNQEELRPTFVETTSDDSMTTKLDYSEIYYFTGVPVQSMTVVTGIKLDTYDRSSQAFLGYVDQIYADEDSLYTTYSYYDYRGFNYNQYVQIIKYDLDTINATISYVGQKKLSGYIQSQYWMDEFEGHLRVVTSSWNPIKNELHILKENATTDELDLVGSITEGLGKENETVKSVRFNGALGYVVTFVNMDPLYTIDLSDPKNPTILFYEEEPGYSTYLHVWGQDDRLIGFGLDGDNQTLKISAYVTGTGAPLDTYFLRNMDDDSNMRYSYSEALWNPKAILVDAQRNIFAFPVMSYEYRMIADEYGWHYRFVSQYYVFRFNFDAANPEDIISDPIIISHDELGFYTGIDRGEYIDGIIYTFSYQQMISYDLSVPFDINNITYRQVINFPIENPYAN
jgi:inhibitor of cysteine peptidase